MDVVANGVQFHVQRLGRPAAGAPAVVFIHGLVIDNMSSLYYSLANPVAQAGADAILYDLRGHGRSERPVDGYTLEDSVEDVLGLLDALGLAAPVHLVGHSYGGALALRAALSHPERIASLVLIEPHCGESDGGGDWVEDIADALTTSALSLEHNPLPEDLRSIGARKARPAHAAHLLLNATTLIEDVASAPPFEEAELSTLACPVLAVYGEHTDLASSARTLAAGIPGCRLEVIAGLAHTVLRDATGIVLGMLLDWLATFSPELEPAR